jgi:ribosomal-protein-alanine N-acetyltransferase
MAQPPTIETKRLLVRAFKDDDVEGLTAVFDDLEAMWDVIAIPGMPRVPRAVAEKRIADSIAGWRGHDAGFWAVVIADAALGPVGDIIGYCGFVNPSAGEAKVEFDDHAALEVGWGIHPAYQRRGLASEAMKPVLDYAFNERICDRLIAITDPENQASQTLSLRLGFEFDSEINAYGTLQVRYVLRRDDYLTRV